MLFLEDLSSQTINTQSKKADNGCLQVSEWGAEPSIETKSELVYDVRRCLAKGTRQRPFLSIGFVLFPISFESLGILVKRNDELPTSTSHYRRADEFPHRVIGRNIFWQ